MKPRLVPFVVDKQGLEAGGSEDTGFCLIDFVNNEKQGLGMPARSMVIRNVGNVAIQFQLCDKNGNWNPPMTLRTHEIITYCVPDGIYVSRMKAWSQGDAMGMISVDAMPGRTGGLTVEQLCQVYSDIAKMLKEHLSEHGKEHVKFDYNARIGGR